MGIRDQLKTRGILNTPAKPAAAAPAAPAAPDQQVPKIQAAAAPVQQAPKARVGDIVTYNGMRGVVTRAGRVSKSSAQIKWDNGTEALYMGAQYNQIMARA